MKNRSRKEVALNGMQVPIGCFYDGEWVSGNGPEIQVSDPATGETLATITSASGEDVDRAVVSAHEAFESWCEVDQYKRSELLHQVAGAIAENSEALAKLETYDTGKPIAQSRSDVSIACQYFDYYAEAAKHLFGEFIPSSRRTQVTTAREPYGVIGHITPWNAPISQLTRGVAPSLAVGNTVVVKPSELAPFSSLLFAELVRNIFPRGVLNVVPGYGATSGAALSSHELIDHLTFTGSVNTGKLVSKAAAKNLIPTNLELGGKSPAIVFPDADLSKAVDCAVKAIVRNSGQSCSALTRFIVHEDVEAQFTSLLLKRVAKLSIGPGIDGYDIGPLISESQKQRVLNLIEEALNDGAEAMSGSLESSLPVQLEKGHFVKPVVLKASRSLRISHIEVFGPVQAIISFKTEEEATAIVNDSEYGLAAAIFTQDINVATRMSRKIRSGQVQINGFVGAGIEVPFGGYKKSGHGREKGFEAMYGYTQLKATVTHLE